MWNLEKEKKVGFILLSSTEYSPTSTTISCVPVWRLQSAHLHSECALSPVGHGKHLRELPYCNYQFFVDPGGFKPVENIVYLKSGIFCFNWPFTSQTNLWRPPWPYLGSTGMNILPCFPTSCHSLEPQ